MNGATEMYDLEQHIKALKHNIEKLERSGEQEVADSLKKDWLKLELQRDLQSKGPQPN